MSKIRLIEESSSAFLFQKACDQDIRMSNYCLNISKHLASKAAVSWRQQLISALNVDLCLLPLLKCHRFSAFRANSHCLGVVHWNKTSGRCLNHQISGVSLAAADVPIF